MKNGNFNARGAALAGAMALGLAMFGGLGTAHAGVEMCQLRIHVVEADLNVTADGNDCSGVVIGGGNVDRTCASLNSKLDSASRKLDEVKLADAYVDLSNFVSKVMDLNTPNAKGETKIADGSTTVDQLIYDGELARDCVGGLLGL